MFEAVKGNGFFLDIIFVLVNSLYSKACIAGVNTLFTIHYSLFTCSYLLAPFFLIKLIELFEAMAVDDFL